MNLFRVVLYCLFFVVTSNCFSQVKPILLTESSFSVKNRSSEYFYFGLKAGDKIEFTINMYSTITNVSFQEHHGSSLFEVANPDTIRNHTIEIEHDGIYYFTFHQSGFLTGKAHCELNAYRIPSNAANVNFNSTVYWEEIIDTVHYKENETYLKQIDTIVTQIVNQSVDVAKKGEFKSTNIMFNLPDSCSSWSYYISSGKAAAHNFDLAEKEFAQNSSIVKKYGLMAGIAINGIASFSPNPKCNEFEYGFVYKKFEEHEMIIDSANALIGLKNTCLDFARIRNLKKNPTHILLRNNSNKKNSIHVKITAVEFKKIWATREVEKFRIETTSIPYLKN